MGWVAAAATVGSTLMQMKAQGEAKAGAELEADYARRNAARKKATAEFEANQLEVQAGQVVAASQRDVLDVQRVGRLAQSRALAVAAASGGGASAPTVINIIGNLAKESAYNGARALYAGEEKARLMKIQAWVKRQEGEGAIEAGEFAAEGSEAKARAYGTMQTATLLNGASSLFGKYGGGGPTGGTGIGYGSAGSADASAGGTFASGAW